MTSQPDDDPRGADSVPDEPVVLSDRFSSEGATVTLPDGTTFYVTN